MKKKNMKPQIITADWKDTEGVIWEFRKAIRKLGGYVYQHPDFVGSDMFGYIVSDRKLTKKEIKNYRIQDT